MIKSVRYYELSSPNLCTFCNLNIIFEYMVKLTKNKTLEKRLDKNK